MRLEVGSIAIQDIEFGSCTELRDHTLVVNRDDIRQLVLEDPHFADVDLHLARPGESVRIVHALDVVEPRWKVAGPGGVFPGLVSPPSSVGEGRTHRLAGVAVVGVGEPVPGEPTHFRERLIDMAGPGAEYTPFGRTLNLVLEFKPNLEFFPPGSVDLKDALYGAAPAIEYERATVLAGIRVAAHLGRTSQDAQPDQVETFDLGPCEPGLLKVVCLYQQHRQPFLYGLAVPLPLGTILHPNEFFDGALLAARGSATSGATYWEQNNEIMVEFSRRHGKDLNFLGCVLFGALTFDPEEKERAASAAAKLARLMGAQAAVLSGTSASNFTIDLMMALQKCEQAGIRTTLVYFEMGSGPDDPGLVFSVPEADAIVCTGSRKRMVTLPRMHRLIGGERLLDGGADAGGEITVPQWHLHSSIGVQGYSRLTTRLE